MFVKIAAKITPTLTSRLTVLYTVLTGLLAVLMVSFIYVFLLQALEEKYDEVMWIYANEVEEMYLKEGLEKVQKTLLEPEEEDPESRKGFIRLMSKSGDLIAATNLKTWPDLFYKNDIFDDLRSRRFIFSTVEYAHRKHPIRTLYWKIDQNHLLQLGFVYEDDSYIVNEITATVVVVTFIVILLGAFVGYFLANRAMKGVKQVTATASDISSGKLTARVPASDQPEEIEQLATTFNIMIDRIESLIEELKNVSNSVAHDLRTPLTRIRGNAEVVLRQDSSVEEYRVMAHKVVEDCERLETMINTMLEIAALDSGMTLIEKNPVNFVELLQDADELFQAVAEVNNQSLEFRLPKEPILISGDRSKLQRVVANLVDNALKFAPVDGRVIVECKIFNSHAVLTVEDNGPGISKENSEKIFHPFFREDKSRTKPGNGLGLWYVKTILEKHDATISFTCPEESGTRFEIWLPIN